MTIKPILFSTPMVLALLAGRKTQTRRLIKPQPFADGYLDGEIDVVEIPADSRGPKAFRFNATAVGGQAVLEEVFEPRISEGDKLWVRETLACSVDWGLFYDAHGGIGPSEEHFLEDERAQKIVDRWAKDDETLWLVPSIFMPRWASRSTLTVTGVKVQRLKDISREDAIAEGIIRNPHAPQSAVEAGCDWTFEGDHRYGSPISAFACLWDSISATPKPVKGDDGKISHYVSYPWDGETRTETYRGKRHFIMPNPWVAAYTFSVEKRNVDAAHG